MASLLWKLAWNLLVLMTASLQRDFQSRSSSWSLPVSLSSDPALHADSLFTLWVSEVTPGYIFPSEDLEIGASDEREGEMLAFLGLFSIPHLPDRAREGCLSPFFRGTCQ